ncbi:MAG: D-alanyl-D-alanine carboxypeptidase [Alphaproteobacteria bacterium]|nr:D-alanyl-D-alanine carboxypeptidase [Alphaproteobacteria bacterium]
MRSAIIFFISLFLIAPIAGAASIETSAKQAIVIDFSTGQILFEKNADERMPTSSMSKVLTAYVVAEEIKSGNISIDEKFRVSEKAWKKGGSKMFVEVGKKVSVRDLLNGVIIQSGNDATIVLAEGIAGTEEKFAEHLNNVAAKLGMENSHFMNASGWPDPDHYSTTRDLATLARHAIKDHPEFYALYAEKEYTYNKIKQQNRNPLLSLDIGADGIKTGHTDIAGYGLIASAVSKKDQRRVIVVINGTDSNKARAEESEKLVTWALNGFKNKTFISAKNDQFKVPVLFGVSDFAPAGVENDLILTVEKLASDEFASKFNAISNLEAPIKKGDIVGTIEVTQDNKPYMTISVIAKADIAELGMFKKLFAKTKHRFSNKD